MPPTPSRRGSFARWRARSRRRCASDASRNSSVEAGGNFGACPKPPHCGSNCAVSARRLAEQRLGQRLVRRLRFGARLHCLGERAGLPDDVAAPRRGQASETATSTWRKLGSPCRGSAGSTCRRRTARPLGVRKTVIGQPPLPGQRDDGVHVDRVEVGPLLAVDLDVDEALVHQRRGGRVLERLVRHHVAPVAGRVADREQDRLVLRARALERLRPHGYQSTGLSACWRRYGLVSAARRFILPPIAVGVVVLAPLRPPPPAGARRASSRTLLVVCVRGGAGGRLFASTRARKAGAAGGGRGDGGGESREKGRRKDEGPAPPPPGVLPSFGPAGGTSVR